ncbi:hypothetical protein Tco_1320386 [Tanacetum coccineum]
MESNDMKSSCLENNVKELRKQVEQKRQMENEYDNALKLLKTHFQTLTLRWEAHESIEYIFGKNGKIKQQNVIKRTNDINSSHEKDKTEGQWSNNELFENVFDHNNEVEKTNEDIKALKEENVLLTKDLKISSETLRLLTNEQNAFRDNLRKSGLGYNGPYVLSQAYAKIPKLYRAYELRYENEQLHVFDSEETLEDAEKSLLKMNEF